MNFSFNSWVHACEIFKAVVCEVQTLSQHWSLMEINLPLTSNMRNDADPVVRIRWTLVFLRTNTPSCFCSVMILFMFVTVTVLIRANVVHFKGSMSIVPTSDALLCHYKSFKMTKKRFISPLQELKMQWFHWNGSGCFLLSCWWCCRAVCVSGNKLFNDSVWFLSVGVWKIRFNVP